MKAPWSCSQDALHSRIRIHGERHPEVALAHELLGTALCERGQLDALRGTQLDTAQALQKELLGAGCVGGRADAARTRSPRAAAR